MSLTQFWSKLFPSRRKKERLFYSLVLLLKTPVHYEQKELEEAAERGWGHPFKSSEDSQFFLQGDGDIALLKCNSFLINLLQAQKPYTPPNREELLNKADDHGKLAWNQHTAWMAFDLLNDYDFSAEQSFSALARCAQQFLSSNCTALFMPSLGKTIVNNGAADRVLQNFIKLDSRKSQ